MLSPQLLRVTAGPIRAGPGKDLRLPGNAQGTVYGEATGGVARLPMRAVRAHALQHTVVNARRDEDLD